MDTSIVSYKSVCQCCKQEVEFLSVFSSDSFCANCQYKFTQSRFNEHYGDKHDYRWTIHPECSIILQEQSAKRALGAKEGIDLKAVRRLKRSRAMRQSRR